MRFHNQGVLVELEGKPGDELRIGVIYRSPNSSKMENDALNREMKAIFEKTKRRTIIFGDFNLPEINWSQLSCKRGPEHQASSFLNTTQNLLIQQLVESTTHHRPNQQGTLIDLVFTNTPEMIKSLTQEPPLGKSHHDILLLDLLTPGKEEPKKSSEVKYCYQRADYTAMREDESLKNLSTAVSELDCEEGWRTIRDTILKLRSKYTPSSRVIIGNKKAKKPLWMNSAALAKVRKKHQAYRRYMSSREGHEYQVYIESRNAAQKEVRKAKRDFERKIAKESKKNPKAFWSYYKEKTRKFQGIPTLVNGNGEKYDENQGKADCLNDFFASVFTEEDLSHTPTIPKKDIDIPMDPLVITTEQVMGKLRNLNVHKAQGPDEIAPRILYELRSELAQPLTILFNKSLEEGVSLKTGRLVLLHRFLKREIGPHHLTTDLSV